MNVSDVMTKNVKVVTSDTDVVDVASVMCIYRISGLPVVEDRKLVGFIAEKDVLQKLFPKIDDVMNEMHTINYEALLKGYQDTLHK